jgi:hypothetical protein
MADAEETRVVECLACEADVRIPLQHGYGGLDVRCGQCGAQITNHALALEMARERMSIEEALPIALKHTYEEIMGIARKVYDEPASITSEERDIMSAFRLLREAGLPSHAPSKLS